MSASDSASSDSASSDSASSDIINYAYVWYKRDPAQLLQFSRDELEKIHEIIMNYSYPCYLAGNATVMALSYDEKNKLLNRELIFIRDKMIEAGGLADIVIIQIPRILYDLFNIYFNNQVGGDTEEGNRYPYSFEYNFNLGTLRRFNEQTGINTNKVKNSIWLLNALIIDYLTRKNYFDNIRDSYVKILDELTKQPELRSYIEYTLADGHRRMGDDEFLQRIRLLHETMDLEKEESKGRLKLYRASFLKHDTTVDTSLSLNTSMLNAIIYDSMACTFILATEGATIMNGEYFYPNQKIIYNIKKFLVGDKSTEDSLFFIPPIHPFLQIYCSGELFHARTKITKPYNRSDIHGLGVDVVPEYLRSEKTADELQRIYEGYKDRDEIFVWYLTNERRPVIVPPLPAEPPALTLAQRLAQRFRALFAPDASQTLPQSQQREPTSTILVGPQLHVVRNNFGTKGGKQTQRRQKQQRKLKHKRYSSLYKKKSKSRRNKSFKN